MVYSIIEYSGKFLFQGKKVSPMTVKRRCEKGLLPSGHYARQLPSESGKKGQWVIEVVDETPPEIIVTKLNPPKPDIKTLNRKYFSFR
jgi:hypothetical protein